nr:e3 ubiquitin-protein ligase rglg5 [Quercus suber]
MGKWKPRKKGLGRSASEKTRGVVGDNGLRIEPLSSLSDPESQLIHEFIESLSNRMPQDGSTNWNLPPRYDVTPDESDDADEMVQDYVADLPLEAHVVEDHVANLPQEAHVVEDHVANLQQECTICVTNARGMAFLCGHTTSVECGERLDRCPICRESISYRISVARQLFDLGQERGTLELYQSLRQRAFGIRG